MAEKVILDVLKAEGATTEDIWDYGYALRNSKNSVQFWTGRDPKFFSGSAVVYKMSMIMTDQERVRYIQEAAKKFVSRNKCVDASLMTMINQAKASSVATPSSTPVSSVLSGPGSSCNTKVFISGIGSGNEYIGILQKAQNSAICACSGVADTGVVPQIVLPTPCVNMGAPPFTQQNLSTIYTAPCTDPGKRDYFPRKIYDGPGCTYTRITTPSG